MQILFILCLVINAINSAKVFKLVINIYFSEYVGHIDSLYQPVHFMNESGLDNNINKIISNFNKTKM